MPDSKHRDIYARTADGGVQLAASSDRWHLYEDYVHLAPHRPADGTLRKFDAELMPFVDSVERGALVVIDMQNDFCSPGGWTGGSVSSPAATATRSNVTRRCGPPSTGPTTC